MASRDPADLSPATLALYERFAADCASDVFLREKGVTVLLTCTWRSNEEQDRLYAQGRTAAGKIVTNARGGQSAHNRMKDGQPAAEAFDVVPLKDGKCLWGTTGQDREIWDHIGFLGDAIGLDWYGLPNSRFREFPHFENPEA